MLNKRKESKEVAPPSLNQIKELLNQLKANNHPSDEQIHIGVTLMSIFGIRASELLALKVSDVLFETQTFLLKSGLQIPIPDRVIAIFERLVQLSRGSNYLFPCPSGKQKAMSPSVLSQSLRKSQSGLTLSSIRYFFADHLNRQDVTGPVLSTCIKQKVDTSGFVQLEYASERKGIYSKLASLVLSECYSNNQLSRVE